VLKAPLNHNQPTIAIWHLLEFIATLNHLNCLECLCIFISCGVAWCFVLLL